MARKRYSRLAKVEHKKNLRSAVVFGILTIILLVIVIAFGLPTVAKLAGFLSDLGKSGSSVEINDNTPPAPPQIEDPPEYTDEAKIQINGTAESGSTITLYFDGTEEETVVDEEGEFSFSLSLDDGENTFYAIATDKAGNESSESKQFTIVYDDEPPDLTIAEPADGASFHGKNDQQIVIKGSTEAGVSLSINDRIVVVDSNGNFSSTTNLSEGENSFNIKAKDRAGNETEKTISVSYSS